MFLGEQLKISPTQYGTFSEQNMGFHQEKVEFVTRTREFTNNPGDLQRFTQQDLACTLQAYDGF